MIVCVYAFGVQGHVVLLSGYVCVCVQGITERVLQTLSGCSK